MSPHPKSFSEGEGLETLSFGEGLGEEAVGCSNKFIPFTR
jgi:hypothetical protein